jgi:hypothetical protein
MRLFLMGSCLLLVSSTVLAEGYRPIGLTRGSAAGDRIQRRILNHQRVRPFRQGQVSGEIARGKAILEQLVATDGVKRGVRRGYGSRDVEFKGRGLAKGVGLASGQSIAWSTRGASHTLKAESSGRVVWTIRRHDRYMNALRGAVTRVVGQLAAEPDRKPTAREQRVLAMAPTDMRAEALARHGLKLERVTSGREGNLKYKLHVRPERLDLFTRVFGPGVSTYMPGKGHSMYVHHGLVWETYPVHGSSTLRPTSRTIYPVMLSNREARRMDLLAASLEEGFRGEGSQGPLKGRGRPANWPIKPGDGATGNTCTTTHHRAPVGSRAKELAWMDGLERSVAELARAGALDGMKVFMPRGLASWQQKLLSIKAPPNPLLEKPLLRVLTETAPNARMRLLDELARQPKITSADRANIEKLKPWIELYSKKLPSFPLELMGRARLKSLMGTPHDPARLGTTDPLGPGYAKGLYSKAPQRVPVLVKLEAK